MQFKSKSCQLQIPHLLRKARFCSVEAFNGLDKVYLWQEGNLLSSKPTDLRINFTQKYPHKPNMPVIPALEAEAGGLLLRVRGLLGLHSETT